MRLLIWLIFFILLIVVPSPLISSLYIVLLGIAYYPFVLRAFRILKTEWVSIVLQVGIAIAYFAVHIPQILRLEIWNDEILSLTVASGSFHTVSLNAFIKGFLPPFHYWELWFWQHLVVGSPPQLTEVIYRLPYMVYHAAGAMVFSFAVMQMAKTSIRGNPRVLTMFLRLTVFLLFFLNPFLLRYALEIRPYAFVSFATALLLLLWVNDKLLAWEFIPFHLMSFFHSFLYVLIYLPFAMSSYRGMTKKNIAYISAMFSVLLVCFTFSSGFMQKTSSTGSINMILRALTNLRLFMIPSFTSLMVILLSCLLAWRKKWWHVAMGALIFSLASMLVLAYLTRYIAFSLRHMIFIVPICLYILSVPLVSMKHWLSRFCGGILLIGVFIIPWMLSLEHSFQTQSFNNRITLGVKPAMEAAGKTGKPLIVNADSHNAYNIYYIVNWYASRYTIRQQVSSSPEDTCQLLSTSSYILLSFVPYTCVHLQNSEHTYYGTYRIYDQ